MNTDIFKTDINNTDDIYNLLNTKNYKKHIDDSINEIINIFMLLLKEYITLIFKKGIKNEYIFNSGLTTLIHIFNVTLYYTKNLKLACYYTQQGYQLYLDFINELNNVNITFLNLKTKDAIMFVYKKTIFCICNEYKKNINEKTFNTIDENKLFENLNKIINIYKIIVDHFSKHILIYFTSEQEINNFCNYLTDLNTLISSKKKDEKVFEILIYFLHMINNREDCIHEIEYTKLFFENVEFFLNNILKKKYSDQYIISKIKKNIDYLIKNNSIIINNITIETIISGSYEI
jgi:hypothetical protein